MNLSQWQDYSTEERLRLLSAIGSAVRNREMPPRRYLLLHPEGRLSDGERQQIYRWTRSERRRIGNTPNVINPTSKPRRISGAARDLLEASAPADRVGASATN